MDNIPLGRSIYSVFNVVKGEVVWVSLDEKNITVYSEETGKTYITKASAVTNLVCGIDQIEDGQPISMMVSAQDMVASAQFIYPELRSAPYPLTISASL